MKPMFFELIRRTNIEDMKELAKRFTEKIHKNPPDILAKRNIRAASQKIVADAFYAGLVAQQLTSARLHEIEGGPDFEKFAIETCIEHSEGPGTKLSDDDKACLLTIFRESFREAFKAIEEAADQVHHREDIARVSKEIAVLLEKNNMGGIITICGKGVAQSSLIIPIWTLFKRVSTEENGALYHFKIDRETDPITILSTLQFLTETEKLTKNAIDELQKLGLESKKVFKTTVDMMEKK